MTDNVNFSDESRDRSILRKAEYDDSDPKDLVLTIPKRDGGKIVVPLLKNARSNVERDDYQENTLVRIKPLAEIASNLPVKSGYNAPVYQGKGVALLRPGYLYIFRNNRLWRELEINQSSQMSDVDLEAVRAEADDQDSELRAIRPSAGRWLDDVLVPVFLQGQSVMHDFRMAYSEVQWDWSYIQQLEENDASRNARTTGVGHAWAVTSVDTIGFATGFPASRVEDVAELRARDLGIELMLENPSDFVTSFEGPGEQELCAKLAKLLKHNQSLVGKAEQNSESLTSEDNPISYVEQLMENPLDLAFEATSGGQQDASEDGEEAPEILDLTCHQGVDLLWNLRTQKGIACVALPDPLFKLRHSLAQLHLALHFLDAVDVSIQKNPMAHSAMLIRQAVFDPLSSGGSSTLANYSDAIDRAKLDEVLDTAEKNHAVRVIEQHVDEIQDMIELGKLDPVFEDYRECNDVALCEAYLLIADKLNVLQQIPGVLAAQGVSSRAQVLTGLRQWILDSSFLTDWAPQTADDSAGSPSPFEKLQKLAEEQTEIDEALLNRLNIQSLVYLEKQLKEKQDGGESILKDLSDAGKVGGLISGALGEWSSAILTVCKRLIEEGVIQQVEIQRIMQAASSNIVLTSPELRGIDVMDRAGAVTRGSIIGMLGNGLNRGLTDFDRSKGILTRKKDYLYADLLDDSDDLVASSSPARAANAVEEAVNKVAGATMVFSAPADHPEARKLGLLKVDFAKRVGKVVDGPAVSRGLVVLAAFNVFLEWNNFVNAWNSEKGNVVFAGSKALLGAGLDLMAASFKLSVVLGGGATQQSGLYKVAARPLFDMKNWVVIGNRLNALKASTLVRTVGLASFAAGAINVAFSSWEMRLSLSNKDFDAATGHAIAVAGGLIFLAQPLMGPLLAIPGWGWAILGMAMVVGGSLYAGAATDDSFEQLLKRGPWGTHPDGSLAGQNDHAYYSQLLSLLSPIQVTASKYADVDPDPALSHPDYAAEPDDYVITVQLPLVSRMRLFQGQECRADLPSRAFNLVVQEVAYQSSSSSLTAPGSVAPVSSTQLVKTTPLTKITARQSLPHQSAVRFLVKRELQDSEYRSLFYNESVETRVRVGIQATLDTELGPIVFPAPVQENFEPFNVSLHSNPPPKEKAFLNPYAQPKSPYWYFTEVTA
ncbi:toxin VasX [Marinobacter sp. GN3S48]|uniref:toxin VasX n=1 Tax=Marinobacter sp. GN3S48 TaxID=3382302 RepID=UPI00387AD321